MDSVDAGPARPGRLFILTPGARRRTERTRRQRGGGGSVGLVGVGPGRGRGQVERLTAADGVGLGGTDAVAGRPLHRRAPRVPSEPPSATSMVARKGRLSGG